MFKYVKTYQNHSEYEDYIASNDFILPNVTHCIDRDDIHYNPSNVDLRVICKYNVTSTSTPTQIITSSTSLSTIPFSAMEIDGVAQSGVSKTYTFDTTGEHTVKYTLKTNTTTIPRYCFYGCESLTSISIPDNVTTVEQNSLKLCPNLETLKIGKNVETFDVSAVVGLGNGMCNNFTYIFVDKDNSHYDSREGCSAIINSTTNQLILGCNNSTIPSTVTSIGEFAFKGCDGLVNITIPNGVTTIGREAFYHCVNLRNVTLPNTLTTIGASVFNGCESLVSIIIPSSVTSIGNNAFNECSSLASLTISSGVESIGNTAFQGCIGLTSITIPSSVTSIGTNPFANCSSIISMSVNSNNTSYDSRGNCNAIIKTSTNELISGCTNTIIPSSVTSIAESAFRGSGITSITIPSSVTSISQYAFYDCKQLTGTLTLPNITSIQGYTFYNCTRLNEVVIPNTVTTIDSNSFYNCGITTLNIPSSVTSIADNAFNYARNLTSITVDSGNTAYDSRGNCNAILQVNTLVVGCKNTVIPNGITSIADNAFYGKDIYTINIPDTITRIGISAFWDSRLSSITIPSNVTTIGGHAFTYSTYLTSIICLATTAPSILGNTFEKVNTNGTLTVPSGSTGYNVWMGTGDYYLGKYGWTMVEQ